MADYLEAYAVRFRLPVRSGVRVESLTRNGDRYVVRAGRQTYEAAHVVVAMSSYQKPRVPALAVDLAPHIRQVHSFDYKSPSDLRPGSVLVVGAGNSGADIALELARKGHAVSLSGRDVGHVPFRIEGFWAALILIRLVMRVAFHYVLTVRTPMGRKVRRNTHGKGGPLVRVKPRDLTQAGVVRVGRVTGTKDGLPLLEDGRTADVDNVVWSSGFNPGYSFVDLPVFDDSGDPIHEAGVVTGEPGLYFVGLHFLYSMSSTMIHGVGRDAARIATVVAKRSEERARHGATRRVEVAAPIAT
jgi:putative flavoprotein involved in K+ transport